MTTPNDDFGVQIACWGYHVGGSETWEFVANVSENHPNTVLNTHRRASEAWDRDASFCNSIVVHPPAPTYRYALAGLAGLLLLQQGINP